MQGGVQRRTEQARHIALADALTALKRAAAELSQPSPDLAIVDGASEALDRVARLCDLPRALRLAELISHVERAIELVRASQGRVLLAPYVQAIVLDLQSSVSAYTAGAALECFVEHAGGLLRLLEHWQPDQLVSLNQFESPTTSSGQPRESPVLKATSRLTPRAAALPHAAPSFASNGAQHPTPQRASNEAPSPDHRATITEIVSTSDMLLTALCAMPSRLELLDSLNVCANTMLDMVAGYPEPLPRLAAAAAELLAAYRAELVVPDEQVCEYLRTLWLMSTLLLATPDPPRALLNAVEAVLGERPNLPRTPIGSSTYPSVARDR